MELEVTRKKVYTGHKGGIYTLSLKQDDDSKFLSASGDGMAVLWPVDGEDEGQLLSNVPTNIFSIAQLPERNLLLLGQLQGGIHVLDTEQNRELRHLKVHDKGVFDLMLMNNNRTLLATGGDGSISVWDTSDFSLQQQVKISDESLRKMAMHPEGDDFAVGASDNCIYIIDARSFEIRDQLPCHKNSVFSVCYSPDGKTLLAGSRDAYFSVWDVGENYELRQSVAAHLFTLNDIVYRPDGRLFATAGRDKEVKIWDAETLQLLKVLDKSRYDGHVNSVNALLWPENETLISAGDDRAIMVWNVTLNEN